jgi:hypothetical protein
MGAFASWASGSKPLSSLSGYVKTMMRGDAGSSSRQRIRIMPGSCTLDLFIFRDCFGFASRIGAVLKKEWLSEESIIFNGSCATFDGNMVCIIYIRFLYIANIPKCFYIMNVES